MPLFRYKALNARGEVLDGQMEAASDREVAQRLQEQGHLPIEARLASEGGGPGEGLGLEQRAPGAGQPLDRALTILLELPEDEAAKRTVADLRDAVRGGSALSTALERQHGTFGKLYVNMVRAGAATFGRQPCLDRQVALFLQAQHHFAIVGGFHLPVEDFAARVQRLVAVQRHLRRPR